MDKAAIRAKARELVNYINVGGMTGDQFTVRIDKAEAALTQAEKQGWNNRGEVDAKACAEVGRNSTKQVRKFIQAVPVSSDYVGQFFADAVKAIRRLRIEEGEVLTVTLTVE